MRRIKHCVSELTLCFLVCLAPWAYGSVEAWAELGLYTGIAVLTLFNNRSSSASSAEGLAIRLPGLALAGIALLSILQAVPLPSVLLPAISPSLAATRARLLPDCPERVLGDPQAIVRLPSATLSVEPDSTLEVATRLIAAWLLFQATMNLNGTWGVSRRIAQAVVCNATLLSIFAIIQGLTWNGCIYWIRPVPPSESAWSAGGPFVNHNHLAAYLNISLGLALGLLFEGNWRDFLRRDSTKPWIAYAAAIIAVGVIISQSRSGFLGFLAACVFFTCRLRRRLITLGVGLTAVLVMIGICLALLGGSSSFGSRLATILDLSNDGYQSRLEIWRRALEAWWARPVWGAGFGTFPVAIIPHLKRHSIAFFARAENEYVDLLVESGVVGFALLLAFLAGMIGLIRTAMSDVSGQQSRGIVEGAAFGLIALSVQSLADFAPHIPAVGVLAVILCGMIGHCARIVTRPRNGHAVESACVSSPDQSHRTRQFQQLRSRRSWSEEPPAIMVESRSTNSRPWPSRPLSSKLAWFGPAVLAILLVIHAVSNVKIENQLKHAGLPLPGTYLATVGTLDTATWGLDHCRHALQTALRSRPNWPEGHIRLGLVHLGLYRELTQTWLEDSGIDLNDITRMSDPLWLLGSAHEQAEQSTGLLGNRDLLSVEPVIKHLVPAARCFLEARRCSPFLALPHAQSAALDYLLESGDSRSTYLRRALTLCGNDRRLLAFMAQIAVETGDRKFAAQCWRKSLAIDPSAWMEIADAARMFLPPEEILTEVTVGGSDAIRFADRLYPESQERPIRDRFFRVSIERFAAVHETLTAEQVFLEAHALANLDDSARAATQMEKALTLKPAQAAWREEYIMWLLHWGRPEDAHAQALTGRYFSPESRAIREAVDRTADALARDHESP